MAPDGRPRAEKLRKNFCRSRATENLRQKRCRLVPEPALKTLIIDARVQQSCTRISMVARGRNFTEEMVQTCARAGSQDAGNGRSRAAELRKNFGGCARQKLYSRYDVD